MQASTVSGQSSSPHGKLTLLPDGYARVKVEDLRYVAAYRIMANDYRRNAVIEVASLRRSIDAKDQQIRAMTEAEAIRQERLKALAERNAQLEDDLRACAKKRDRLRTFAAIGKVFVGVCVAGAGYGIYQTTIQP
jgi:hypothetical protein